MTVYIIQRWLNGVNSTSVVGGTYDMGQDGVAAAFAMGVAKNVQGFSLKYFTNDYVGIRASKIPFAKLQSVVPTLADNVQTGGGLYNRNIRAMLVNIPKLGDAQLFSFTGMTS